MEQVDNPLQHMPRVPVETTTDEDTGETFETIAETPVVDPERDSLVARLRAAGFTDEEIAYAFDSGARLVPIDA